MSADPIGGIGPVSVRYAAQIREMLHAQAMHRMAAEQEAARASAQAERTARAAKAEDPKPIQAKVEAPETTARPEPVKAPEAKPEARPEPAPAHIVDIHA